MRFTFITCSHRSAANQSVRRLTRRIECYIKRCAYPLARKSLIGKP